MRKLHVSVDNLTLVFSIYNGLYTLFNLCASLLSHLTTSVCFPCHSYPLGTPCILFMSAASFIWQFIKDEPLQCAIIICNLYPLYLVLAVIVVPFFQKIVDYVYEVIENEF